MKFELIKANMLGVWDMVKGDYNNEDVSGNVIESLNMDLDEMDEKIQHIIINNYTTPYTHEMMTHTMMVNDDQFILTAIEIDHEEYSKGVIILLLDEKFEVIKNIVIKDIR